MEENVAKSPDEIIERLEGLRLWQEQQQRLLIEKQNEQRKMLGLEQQKMYEMLGLSPSIAGEESIVRNSLAKGKHKDQSPLKIFNPSQVDPRRNSRENPTGAPQNICEGKQEVAAVLKHPRRTFLKRGQGLTKRFGVDPEKFRLENLPKYKYANVHRKYLKPATTVKKLSGPKSNVSKLKLRYKQKIGNNCDNGVEQEEIEETPVKNSLKESTDPLEMLEKWTTLPKASQGRGKDEDDRFLTLDDSQLVSWAKVLDPTNIKPISVKDLRGSVTTFQDSTIASEQNETEDLSLFELLEQKVQNGSLSSDASILRKLFQRIKEKGSSLNDLDANFLEQLKAARVSPLPCDIEQKIVIDDEDAEDSDDEIDENPKRNRIHVVRFSDDVQIKEVDVERPPEMVNSTDSLSTIDASKTSTPNSKDEFERFRARLFENSTSTTSELEHTLVEELKLIEQEKLDILEKSETLRVRLLDLESEITQFQNHNAELIKLKQDHELECVKLDQHRVEINEKLNDERIKLEIYLHDERMKIEEERRKILREAKTPNRRDREEIDKLKEQVENLHKELKAKETKHVSAQSRLRAQIRNLEKDIKELTFEVEHLKKENKKLESENGRLARQNNNRMLQEINKTIAKLAPKMQPEVTEVRNRNPKPVVARVISHISKASRGYHRTASAPNLVEEESSMSEPEETEIASVTDVSEDNRSSYFREEKPRKKNRSSLPNHNVEPERKHSPENKTSSPTSNEELTREIVNPDGSKDVWYTNGNLKKTSSDGMLIRMLYYNKDIKETNINEGTVKYYYAETNTWHTTYLDGLEILEFPNGQTEHRYKDGTVEVHFPNGAIRITNSKDDRKVEEWKYPDGTTSSLMKNGDKILCMPNGQQEIHTQNHKRRIFPDGTVKIVYLDGSQETRYSNGRVRLKDKDGNLVMDSENIK